MVLHSCWSRCFHNYADTTFSYTKRIGILSSRLNYNLCLCIYSYARKYIRITLFDKNKYDLLMFSMQRKVQYLLFNIDRVRNSDVTCNFYCILNVLNAFWVRKGQAAEESYNIAKTRKSLQPKVIYNIVQNSWIKKLSKFRNWITKTNFARYNIIVCLFNYWK